MIKNKRKIEYKASVYCNSVLSILITYFYQKNALSLPSNTTKTIFVLNFSKENPSINYFRAVFWDNYRERIFKCCINSNYIFYVHFHLPLDGFSCDQF